MDLLLFVEFLTVAVLVLLWDELFVDDVVFVSTFKLLLVLMLELFKLAVVTELVIFTFRLAFELFEVTTLLYPAWAAKLFKSIPFADITNSIIIFWINTSYHKRTVIPLLY